VNAAANEYPPGRRRGGQALLERLSLPADQASGRDVRQALTTLYQRCGVPGDPGDDFSLAVSEAFSNAVRHGACAEEDEIDVCLEMSAEGCRVTLSYAGEPFALDAPGLPHDTSTNGRGRYLMSVLADAVEYEFGQGRTRVVLSKRWKR
jgi:anti-sigma regulatory factor (Ser/Thr protein kinase)